MTARLLTRPGEDADDRSPLIVLDQVDAGTARQLLAPLPYVRSGVHLLVAGALPVELGAGWTGRLLTDPSLVLEEASVSSVLSSGEAGEVSRAVHEAARADGVPVRVLQASMLTPFTPPPPPDAELLTWSAQDGEFWRSGRADTTVTEVGAQRLWELAHETVAEVEDGPPVFVAHLRDERLSRTVGVRSVESALRREPMRLLPHRDDADALSRAALALWRRRGVDVLDARRELPSAPVVGVRRMELLESAARGIPVRVHAPGAPRWLQELWERYDLRPLGSGDPTPPPHIPSAEPATAIAELIDGAR